MSISAMTLPFKAISGMVWDAAGKLVARCNDNSIELCSILNAHFEKKEEPKPETPQPNREETDRVAAKYYESGRKLEVQYFNTVNGWCVTSHPHFDYSLAWRLTPKRRRVVVEVYKLPDGSLSSVLVGSEGSFPGWRLLGTIEGEVEA